MGQQCCGLRAREDEYPFLAPPVTPTAAYGGESSRAADLPEPPAFPPVKVELPPVKAELPPVNAELPAKTTSEDIVREDSKSEELKDIVREDSKSEELKESSLPARCLDRQQEQEVETEATAATDTADLAEEADQAKDVQTATTTEAVDEEVLPEGHADGDQEVERVPSSGSDSLSSIAEKAEIVIVLPEDDDFPLDEDTGLVRQISLHSQTSPTRRAAAAAAAAAEEAIAEVTADKEEGVEEKKDEAEEEEDEEDDDEEEEEDADGADAAVPVADAVVAADAQEGKDAAQEQGEKEVKPKKKKKKKGEKVITLPNCDQILPYLYLGGMAAATDVDGIQRQGLGAICCCCRTVEFPDAQFIPGVSYYRVDVEDMSREPLDYFLKEATDFIHSFIVREQPVLVHCRAGVSRSASVVLAYLVACQRMTLADAFVLLRSRRCIVTPNLGFFEQLSIWEKEVSGVSSVDCNKYNLWFGTPEYERSALPDMRPDY
ncbi:Dusp14 [Symbiodinium necroappetens]|uniref:Dusp14 protein n=1 Tax=Symbiodinium necroappetens TaxID=1628268 RepID=A0A812U1R3_9DINO|nr:Dusp14 [Symbiodinium necroappetens]